MVRGKKKTIFCTHFLHVKLISVYQLNAVTLWTCKINLQRKLLCSHFEPLPGSQGHQILGTNSLQPTHFHPIRLAPISVYWLQSYRVQIPVIESHLKSTHTVNTHAHTYTTTYIMLHMHTVCVRKTSPNWYQACTSNHRVYLLKL